MGIRIEVIHSDLGRPGGTFRIVDERIIVRIDVRTPIDMEKEILEAVQETARRLAAQLDERPDDDAASPAPLLVGPPPDRSRRPISAWQWFAAGAFLGLATVVLVPRGPTAPLADPVFPATGDAVTSGAAWPTDVTSEHDPVPLAPSAPGIPVRKMSASLLMQVVPATPTRLVRSTTPAATISTPTPTLAASPVSWCPLLCLLLSP